MSHLCGTFLLAAAPTSCRTLVFRMKAARFMANLTSGYSTLICKKKTASSAFHLTLKRFNALSATTTPAFTKCHVMILQEMPSTSTAYLTRQPWQGNATKNVCLHMPQRRVRADAVSVSDA